MFKIGEYVVYGTVGVCTVENITTLNMRDVPKEKQYYVLEPLSRRSNKIFAPVENAKVPMRKIITKDEAEKLIEKMPGLEEIQVENRKLADSIFKEMLKTGDVDEFAKVIKTLYVSNRKRVKQGKKVTATGERYMRIAEEALYSELAVALSTPKDRVSHYIEERLKDVV